MSDDEINPREPFYLGFIDFRRGEGGKWVIEAGDLCNGNQISQDIDVVMNEAIDAAEEHGGETIIYRCVPIKRVYPKKKHRVECLQGDGTDKDTAP